MFGALIVVSLFAVLLPLVLWAVIHDETSDPTVVDRSEAERIAKARGGRGSHSDDNDEKRPRDEDRFHTGWDTRDEDSDRNDGPRTR